jgi:putative tryptophan/tyrosine transport system substrate-binding protein
VKLAEIVLLGVLGITGLVPITLAQPATKQVTLGVLDASGKRPSPALTGALWDLGYRQGRNLTIEFRSANGRNEELPRLAAELVSLKPDVIVAGGTPSVLAVKQATGSIPIVIYGAGDRVGYGLVQSLAHGFLGGSITGLHSPTLKIAPILEHPLALVG